MVSRTTPVSTTAAEVATFSGATSLDALRVLTAKTLSRTPGRLASLPSRILAAGRACLLICNEMDTLLNSGQHLGAVHDASIYAHCARGRPAAPPPDTATALADLAGIADHATRYLAGVGMLDAFVDLVTELLDVAAIETEPDDLLLHRCLHVWYAVAETYMKALLARIDPAEHLDGRGASGYEKGDTNQSVLDTALGPILGHNHYLSPLVATCSATDTNPHTAFLSYADAVITYMPDWESLPRERGMASAIASALGAPVERARRDHAHDDDPQWIWLRRNALGTKTLRWFANMDAAVGVAGNASLLHTGILCNLPESVRKAILLCLGYGQFGLWPIPRLLSLADYGRYGCAALGEMLRGWTSDHDSEAAMDEHSPLNWMCVECATLASRECMLRHNALGSRTEWEARIAWAPHPFNFIGGRHQGLRRRTDTLRTRTARPNAPIVRQTSPTCVPIRSGDQLAPVVGKLLALVGLTPEPGLIEQLTVDEWDVKPRMCPECDFPGSREQMFMLAVGCARLGALLPRRHMNAWIPLIEKYAYRLFPALQVRLLVQCGCTPFWVSDILSAGYQDAGTSCGLSACLATRSPMPPTVMWDHPAEDEQYDGKQLRQQLLDQATAEALQYATDTGRADWLALVTRPLSAL